MGWFSDLFKPEPGERLEDYPVVIWEDERRGNHDGRSLDASLHQRDRYEKALRDAGIECKQFGFEIRARVAIDAGMVARVLKHSDAETMREVREKLSAYNETRAIDDMP